MTPIRHLPMSKLAYQDPTFMGSLPARPLRILAEYLDPLTRLRQQKIADTIVMFGSARISPRDRALDAVKRLQDAPKKLHKTKEWRTKLRDAKPLLERSHYYEDALGLCRRTS